MQLGIAAIDDALSKAPPGQPLLVRAEPGVDAKPLLRQAAQVAIEHGMKVVYVSLDRPPKAVLASLGVTDEDITILDAYSPHVGLQVEGTIPIKDIDNVDAFIAAIEAEAGEDRMVILDSLSSWALRTGPARMAARRDRLYKALSAYGASVVWFAEWQDPHTHELLAPFRTRLDVLAVTGRIVTNNYLRMERVDGEAVAKSPALMYREGAQGIQLYVPKVVVTGPPDAGKTTFVRSTCDTVAQTERRGTTVAMDRGVFEMPGLRAELFGTPGQDRFRPLIDTILRQAIGVLVLADATAPDTFEKVREALGGARMKGRAVALLVTHMDRPGALPAKKVAQQVGLRPEDSCYECDATDAKESRAVLESFLGELLSRQDLEVHA